MVAYQNILCASNNVHQDTLPNLANTLLQKSAPTSKIFRNNQESNMTTVEDLFYKVTSPSRLDFIHDKPLGPSHSGICSLEISSESDGCF